MFSRQDALDVPTMKNVFEMFAKSVSQILQSSTDQQTFLDEVRAQMRSLQNQITKIDNQMDEFENRIFIKIQEMKPTIYTRDGVPLDDAIDLIQQKSNAFTEKALLQQEAISRLENDVSLKVDSDFFKTTIEEKMENIKAVGELSSSLYSLKVDFQKQRDETSQLSEKMTEMVDQKLESHRIKVEAENFEADMPVTRSVFETELRKLKYGIFGSDMQETPLDRALASGDPAQIAEAFEFLMNQQNMLEDVYGKQKQKLEDQLGRLQNIGEDSEDFISYSEEFDFVVDESERTDVKLRSISVDHEGNIGDEEVEYRVRHGGKRRSVGILVSPQGMDADAKKKIKEIKAKMAGIGSKSATTNIQFDEAKFTSEITSTILGHVEDMLVDLLSTQGIAGVKLEKRDAQKIVSSLSNLQDLKKDVRKALHLVNLKMDAVTAERELEVRITRDEFFTHILALFPNNPQLSKLVSSLRSGIPITSETTPRKEQPRSNPGMNEEVVRPRTSTKPKTSGAPNFSVSRNSRFLSLNQKFLKGSDGKFYLRDIGDVLPETSFDQTVSSQQALDFQPFLKVPHRPEVEEPHKVPVLPSIRSKTPPDSST